MSISKLETWISDFIIRESLPASFRSVILDHYIPIAEHVRGWRAELNRPLILGVNGAQGTGKSTLAIALQGLLEIDADLKTAILSIDDLYLTKTERNRLSREKHPLLATRGVPGTHDVGLGVNAIQSLIRGETVLLPRFDKSIDDRAPQSAWEATSPPVDVIILEGWCVGAQPELQSALEKPINSLEAEEDADGMWRSSVNEQLATDYPRLFGLLDRLIMLKAPDFECVHHWRGEQEAKLRARVEAAGQTDLSGIMDKAALSRFIMHYERLTRHMLAEMPNRADAVLYLKHDHTIE